MISRVSDNARRLLPSSVLSRTDERTDGQFVFLAQGCLCVLRLGRGLPCGAQRVLLGLDLGVGGFDAILQACDRGLVFIATAACTLLGDYIATHLKDPMSRISGVGSTNLTGAQYAMRIWCDPLKFEQFQLNPSDVIAAVREQNAQSTGGQIGANPALPGQEINIAINAASRLESAQEFENIFLRALPDGSSLLLKDVARIELGSESAPAALSITANPPLVCNSNWLQAPMPWTQPKAIKARVDALKPFFPPGLQAIYPYDSTLFVNLSIKAVFTTLGEAIVLVFLVMYLFLQNSELPSFQL